MEKVIATYIESNNLLTPGSTVISCISGGADSVCMTHILVKLGYDVIGAHCNFHLRGGESDRDAAFTKEFCNRLGITLYTTDFDTEEYSKTRKIGTEEAARELRYNWFENLRAKLSASAICVAHHRDDSIETSLLNLIRGAGIKGICGIKNKNGYITRPMLCLSRKEIEEYLHSNNIEYITDSTNLENNYNRNKIRNIIIPEIEKIKPNFAETMVSNMENFSSVAKIYDNIIEEQKKSVLIKKENTLYVNLSKVSTFIEPETLLFEILKQYNIHPREISKIFTMERGKSISNGSVTLTIVRDGKSRVLKIS